MCNPVNSEPCRNDNPGIFRTPKYLKLDTYSEPYERFKMECLAKIVKSYNYFTKVLYRRFLAVLWIGPSLNKYSLTWRVTSTYVLYETYSEPWHNQNLVYYCKFRNIHMYCGIFRTLCSSMHILNPAIMKILN